MNAPAQPLASLRTTHLLYLHGFRSSPQSAKAQMMARWVTQRHPGVRWCCPQLPPSPAAAAHLIERLSHDWPSAGMAVVGSSLGGFYARWLALRRGCRAALLNPAPFPQRDLAAHLGAQPMWHSPQERIFFLPEYVQELAAMADEIDRLRPLHPASETSLFALISQQDEVLDWQEMRAFCAGARITLLPESNHAIDDFELHLAKLMHFLRLAA